MLVNFLAMRLRSVLTRLLSRSFCVCIPLVVLLSAVAANAPKSDGLPDVISILTRSIATATLSAVSNSTETATRRLQLYGLPSDGPIRPDPNYAVQPANASAIIASLPALNAQFSVSADTKTATIELVNNGTKPIVVDTADSFLQSGSEGAYLKVTAVNGAVLNRTNSAAARQDILFEPLSRLSNQLTVIQPGSTVHHTVDLSQFFTIAQTANYTVSLPPDRPS